jgi:uncharacterized protein
VQNADYPQRGGKFSVKLDLRGLLAGDRLLTFDYELNLNFNPDDTSSVLYGVCFPSPMKVTGEITNTAGYMRMTLRLAVDYQTTCARCLSDVSGEFTLDLEKTVATKEMLGELYEDKPEQFSIVENGFLDMDEELVEELEMAFPIRFLCRDDCKGLCQRCGTNLNLGECDCKSKEFDARLAPLKDILERMKSEN